MSYKDQYDQIFIELFAVEPAELAGLSSDGSGAWDSVSHMQLVAMIEDAFDIMLDTDDVIDFDSYEKGLELLAKYDISE